MRVFCNILNSTWHVSNPTIHYTHIISWPIIWDVTDLTVKQQFGFRSLKTSLNTKKCQLTVVYKSKKCFFDQKLCVEYHQFCWCRDEIVTFVEFEEFDEYLSFIFLCKEKYIQLIINKSWKRFLFKIST